MSIFTVLGTVTGMMDELNAISSKGPAGYFKEKADKFSGKFEKGKELLEFDGNIVKFVNTLNVSAYAFTTDESRRSQGYDDALNTMLDIFSGFYLQAFQILTQVYGGDAKMVINLLNSKGRGYLAKEDSTPLNVDNLFSDSIFLNCEDVTAKNGIKTSQNDRKDETFRDVYLQRWLNINIETRGVTITIPISVSLNVINTDIMSLCNMIDPISRDKSLISRWREYRSGAITLTDFIFAQDLRAEYRKNKLRDKDNIMDMVNDRVANANIKFFTEGVKGFDGKYNMLLLSPSDIDTLSKMIKGDVRKPKYKEELLDKTSSILFTELDDDYERAVIYITDTQAESKVPFSKLKRSNGNKGNSELIDVVKALMVGRPVTF